MEKTLLIFFMLVFTIFTPAFAQHTHQHGTPPTGTAGENAMENEQTLKNKLKGMTARDAVDFANQCRLEKSRLVSFVSPEAVHFQFTDGTEITVPLPRDQMVVSIAPYISWTHPCTTHYISKCDAELKNTPVKIKAVTAGGKMLIDETLKSPTGFFDLWLPRDQEIDLFVSARGKNAKGKITTYKDSPTCNSTLKLQ